MGVAKVLLKDEHSMLCEWGGDDREAANLLLDQVLLLRNQPNAFIRCDNGGGFSAGDVIGITVPSGPPAATGVGGPPGTAAAGGAAVAGGGQ